MAKKKNVQTPRASIFNRLGDGGPHVQAGSNIDTKKKESTFRTSVWRRIKHTDIESCHGKEFPCEVKRHDVILTNPEKEDSEDGEGEISCHHITILKELEIETPEEDTEDVPQSLDGGQSTLDELKEIEVEVNKLIEARFIREVKYPTWIANIVPVRKKNGQLRVCVDFCDLNNACPKDDFPLPITKIMVDATTGHEALSFMDGSSGYNQIRMDLLDEEMTTFRTPKGIYCYKVMPFGLKNVGATYQRAMQKVFDDMLHKYVECYVDDLVVKPKRQQDHLKDLKAVFDRLRKYQLRMNPLKCAFGVTLRNFFGFIAFTVHLVAKADPIKYVLSRPIISRLLAKWAVLLQQYDIVYISQKPIKGQALADFLADHPIPSDWKLCEDLPDGEVFFTKVIEPWTIFMLAKLCSNNVAEYQALIVGLQMALEIREANVTTSHLIDEEDWRQPIIKYLEHGKLPKDSRHKTESLYIQPWLLGRLRLGDLIWLALLHRNHQHDILILAATDYFSKWAEAIPLREAKKENVANFIRSHIIYRYGIPHRIVTDNGRQFSNNMIDKLCEKFKFKQYKSSMYNALANGLAEAFNKTLCNLLKKIVSKSKRDWQERIDEALWAYRTTQRTPTGVTPYSLVYGVEAILFLEREIPSLRMVVQEGLTTKDNVKLRLQELEALDEKRLEAQQALECYQARMSKAFDKHVKPRSFQVGDLVLAVRRPIITTRHTGNKFTPKWDGLYIVKEVYTNGAYKIVDKLAQSTANFLRNFMLNVVANREGLHLHLLTCVAAEKLVVSNMLHREDRHLKYVAVRRSSSPIGCIKRMIISNMLQPRRSSPQICCNREGHHLKYVVVEKVVVSHMLQRRRLSSQICCSQEGRRLNYVVAEKVFVSNMLQLRRSWSQICCSREGRRLKYVATEAIDIFIFIFMWRKQLSSSIMQRRRSSSSRRPSRDDHHLHLKYGRHLHLQCNTVEMIIIFIFNTVQQRQSLLEFMS
ncbi:uncharacterized protein E5676_scaffold640G00360 [Cucumis melo var. makuwa]|uniref:Integrase catalytic domain-containing protein n=1 Tax=Cucumis melo var. makuwa TaxID=1194695 RepID=A0A5A7V172_CUCMM|nr:uncharacterized protein E6C27_scaffold54G00040 [Cucumis melo var. makuwa]TYK25791.1 uncharacterized protein E5676_scaffold640G00360 [Cucumis melo var. makuwa]